MRNVLWLIIKQFSLEKLRERGVTFSHCNGLIGRTFPSSRRAKFGMRHEDKKLACSSLAWIVYGYSILSSSKLSESASLSMLVIERLKSKEWSLDDWLQVHKVSVEVVFVHWHEVIRSSRHW